MNFEHDELIKQRKSKTKKQGGNNTNRVMLRNIIVFACVVVFVVIGTIWAISKIPEVLQSDGENTIIPEELRISNRNKTDLEALRIHLANNEELVFAKNSETGETLVDWTLENLNGVVPDVIKVEDILNFTTRIMAEDILINEGTLSGTDKEAFGFTAPIATVYAKYGDGTEKTYLLGNKVPGFSTYYFMVEGENTVYSVWSTYYMYFSRKSIDYLVLPKPELDSSKINYIKFYNKSKDLTLTMDMYSKNTIGYEKWRLRAPYDAALDADKMISIQSGFGSGIAAASVITSTPTPAELEQFGLAEPLLIAEAKDSDNLSYHIEIGGSIPELSNYSYCRINGEDTVYSVATTYIDFINYVSAISLVDVTLFSTEVGYVTNLDIQSLEASVNLDFDQEFVYDEKGNQVFYSDGRPDRTQNFFIRNNDGTRTQTTDAASRGLYFACITMKLDNEATKQVDTSVAPVCSVVYSLDGGNKVRIRFFEYDFDRYAVEMDGDLIFTCYKTNVTSMLAKVKTLLANPTGV